MTNTTKFSHEPLIVRGMNKLLKRFTSVTHLTVGEGVAYYHTPTTTQPHQAPRELRPADTQEPLRNVRLRRGDSTLPTDTAPPRPSTPRPNTRAPQPCSYAGLTSTRPNTRPKTGQPERAEDSRPLPHTDPTPTQTTHKQRTGNGQENRSTNDQTRKSDAYRTKERGGCNPVRVFCPVGPARARVLPRSQPQGAPVDWCYRTRGPRSPGCRLVEGCCGVSSIVPNWAVTDVRQSPNVSGGRPAGPPSQIVIHHWGRDGQSHDNVVGWLCKPGSGASAHYVVSGGRVTQLVSDRDRAWHAGHSGNPRGIGIECRPEMSQADIDTVVRLIRAIRSEHGPLPLKGHRDFMSTACPGRWYSMLSTLSAAADGLSAVNPAPAPRPAPRPAPGRLVVDGVWGPATEGRLSAVMLGDRASSLSAAFAYANLERFLIGQGYGSSEALRCDGSWSAHTTSHLQWWMWDHVPGVPVSTVWRDWAPGWLRSRFVDGVWGPATCAVLQEALNRSSVGSQALLR